VLNILVPEVKLEPTGMAEHVWVDREWHVGGLPDTLDEVMEADGAASVG
jgi:hypothetical protein